MFIKVFYAKLSNYFKIYINFEYITLRDYFSLYKYHPVTDLKQYLFLESFSFTCFVKYNFYLQILPIPGSGIQNHTLVRSTLRTL